MPRHPSIGIPRRLTHVAIGGALCVATLGTAVAIDCPSGATLAQTATAIETSFLQHTGDISNPPHQTAAELTSFDEVGVIIATAHRAAVRAEAAKAAAARLAAAHAAAKAAAARQAAAQRAAAQQAAAAQQPAQQAVVYQAAPGTAQQIAEQLLGDYGWSQSQFSCLDPLWAEESGWNVFAENPATGAYGIPQALPGDKMASAGADWQTDAATQIRWGLSYIQATYGTPCAAWSHEEATGWY